MERYIQNSFEDFQDYARLYNLVRFSNRVTAHYIDFQDIYSVFPPWQFEFFEDMLNQMTQAERHNYHHSTVLLYRRLIMNSTRWSLQVVEMVVFLRRTFTLLLRFAQNCSFQNVGYLVFVCQRALGEDTGVFLRIVSRDDLDIVLQCFPNHRCDGWSIQNSRALMAGWVDEKLRLVPLIKYGFPYQFDIWYFEVNLNRLTWRTSWRLMVNGIDLSPEIDPEIYSSGNLRMQLAVDLLLVHFDEDEERRERNKKFCELMWRAMPFPYISSVEMFNLLRPYFIEERLALQDVCDEYENRGYIFVVPVISEPRTLMHLCRVQIRKSLCELNTISVDELIDSISSQVIPRLIKDYLKLNGVWD